MILQGNGQGKDFEAESDNFESEKMAHVFDTLKPELFYRRKRYIIVSFPERKK